MKTSKHIFENRKLKANKDKVKIIEIQTEKLALIIKTTRKRLFEVSRQTLRIYSLISMSS